MTAAGIIGIGVMGSAMAANLLRAGFEVVGYDPSAEAMEAFCAGGGTRAASARAVVEACGVSLASLPSAAALAAVAQDAAAAGSTGQVIAECSTLPLEAKRDACGVLAQAGKTLLDCPVSGTGAQAATADLVILGSGERAAFDRCQPVFAAMSRVQRYLGAFGNGSVMKFVANHLVTIHNVAAAEAMVLGMKAGIDPAVLVETLSDSAGSSRMLQMRAPLMRDGRYAPPTASVRTHLKDLSIITAFAQSLDCPTALFSAASQPYHDAAEQGMGALDTASVCAVLERAAGLPPRHTIAGEAP